MTTLNTENTLKILEEHYKAIKEQKNAWDFFLNTAEYVRFVEQNKQFSETIKKIAGQQSQAYGLLKEIENKAVKDLQCAMKTMLDAIEKAKINLEPINNIIRDIQLYNTGGILTSVTKSHQLDSYLFDIARTLKANGFEKTIERFIDEQKQNKNIYGNFTFSKILPIRDKAEEEFDSKRRTEMWGAWEDMPFISRIVFDEVNFEKELEEASQRDKLKKWELINYMGVRSELYQIKNGSKMENDLVFFRVSDFKAKIDRVHRYLMTELLLNTEESRNDLSFDDKAMTLCFMGVSIIISKKEESDPHKLIRTLFKDKSKVWANDEIIDDWCYSSGDEIPKNKVYQAGKTINRTVAQETKIKDFLNVSTKSISINKKYLKT